MIKWFKIKYYTVILRSIRFEISMEIEEINRGRVSNRLSILLQVESDLVNKLSNLNRF